MRLGELPERFQNCCSNFLAAIEAIAEGNHEGLEDDRRYHIQKRLIEIFGGDSTQEEAPSQSPQTSKHSRKAPHQSPN